MEELQNIKIKMEVINQYGDRFAIEQEVPEDFCDMSEMEIYHNAYMNFLRAVGFCFDLDDSIEVISKDEYIVGNCEIDD